jgi:hypothetical protein
MDSMAGALSIQISNSFTVSTVSLAVCGRTLLCNMMVSFRNFATAFVSDGRLQFRS